ncbi:hypothetical protein ACWD5Z_08975 [Micromonospora chokoriensis]
MAWEWVAPSVTGIVGTVTISATVWLAHKQFALQEGRALKADRRAAYGKFLRATHQMEDCATRIVANQATSDKESLVAIREARSEAMAAIAEIAILGPTDVADTAESYLMAILRDGLEEADDEIVRRKNVAVLAMKQALGS